ncbi:hypothetical protein M0813_01996 [Anaeramoeba flamelloides]|uniref:Transmembrane protein n=1 Tax=Anaeramoeba flamelloides TaxID=1746091 RepID=A0ABQ8YQ82_9EUKA|nr:hypothetical protein M0813_01996 [Anaeramoeba flamelloides]
MNAPISLSVFASLLPLVLTVGRTALILKNKTTKKSKTMSQYLNAISLVIILNCMSTFWMPCHNARRLHEECYSGIMEYVVGSVFQVIILFALLIFFNFETHFKRQNYQEIVDISAKEQHVDEEKNKEDSEESSNISSSESTTSSSINSNLNSTTDYEQQNQSELSGSGGEKLREKLREREQNHQQNLIQSESDSTPKTVVSNLNDEKN